MHIAPSQSHSREIGHAMTLARSGQLDAAEACLQTILASIPDHPDALQLLGMVARRRGNHEAAITLFRKSLDVRPHQPHVLNNLGNSLSDMERHPEAAAAYQKALELDATHEDARLNLALARINLGQPAAAQQILRAFLAAHPDHARAWAILGQAGNALKQNALAIEAYLTALRLRPGHLPWMHNLAVALRLAGRAGEALPLLRECDGRSPDEARIRYNLGHCLQDLGQIDEAAAAYRQAISLAPTEAAMHESLGRLLWEHHGGDSHLHSFRAALALHPRDPGLLEGLANRLTLGGKPQDAVALLAPAEAQGIGGATLQFGLARALWSCGRTDDALAAYDMALASDPGHLPSLREQGRALLILGRPQDAIPLIEKCLAADPCDQQALALQGIAWRLLGDSRAGWLNDQRLIGTLRLLPDGNAARDFNRQLDAALDTLHLGRNHPLEQTLKGGTQTSDDLFTRDLPEVQAVRAMIEKAIHRYIAALPDDPTHPFLNRKTSGFALSGSWSVRLHDGGHHSNHIHPEGWISAVYYVALPDAVADGEQGWLTFGETGLKLGPRERIDRKLRPEPGLLVLFPSYFYHGTIPFADRQHRTTIAFDIVPVGGL